MDYTPRTLEEIRSQQLLEYFPKSIDLYEVLGYNISINLKGGTFYG